MDNSRESALKYLKNGNRYVKNWFSNMLPFDKPLIYQGIKYKTVENFYQAMKLPKDRLDMRREIASLSPFDAKKLIRDKAIYPWREDWDKSLSIVAMKFAVEWKFKHGTSWR